MSGGLLSWAPHAVRISCERAECIFECSTAPIWFLLHHGMWPSSGVIKPTHTGQLPHAECCLHHDGCPATPPCGKQTRQFVLVMGIQASCVMGRGCFVFYQLNTSQTIRLWSQEGKGEPRLQRSLWLVQMHWKMNHLLPLASAHTPLDWHHLEKNTRRTSWHLVSPRHVPGTVVSIFMWIISLNLHPTPWDGHFYYSHFTEVETEAHSGY